MSLMAVVLDNTIHWYLWIWAVHPPRVFSVTLFVAAVPSSASFLVLVQCFHEHSDPKLDKHLLVALFLSCSSTKIASAAVVASSSTQSLVLTTAERFREKMCFQSLAKCTTFMSDL